MSDPALTVLLASYVPKLIQKRVVLDSAPIESPVAENFQAAVLFADISGFTLLTERLAEEGPAGVETLARILNEYFGQLIEIIHNYGGDVVKFAGDAVIAVWPIESDSPQPDSELQASLWRVTMRAAECALEIRERLVNYKIEDSTLYLKLAVSTGQIGHVHVGGVFNRWEFLLTGAPLVELGVANNLAKAGEILITPSSWKVIRADCKADPVEFDMKAAIAQAGQLNSLTKPSSYEKVGAQITIPDEAQSSLRAYIPGAIINRLSAGQSGWIAELRRVTVLFINLPDINEKTPLEEAQNIARLLQRSVYRYEGSINKINVDDKGITVVAALGLPPFAHEDDPARGVKSALMIRKELLNLDVRSYIGITTGRIFCGSIGNAARREYTIIGNAVNMSARLMSAAKAQKDLVEKYGVPILCDRQTFDSAKEAIEFESIPAVQVKGRGEPMEVFHPLEEKKSVIRPKTELIGRLEEKSLLANALQELTRGAPLQALLFHGEAGIGKSRLTEELIRQAASLNVRTFVGGGDSIEKNSSYHAWRSVFSKLFDIEEILNHPQLTEEDRIAIHDKTIDKLNEIDPDLVRYAPLLDVVLPPVIPENEFTSAMTGETRGGNIRELLVRLLNHEAAQMPLIIAIEDLHWLDSASWTLLADVHQKVRPVLLILNTRPLSMPVQEEFNLIANSPETIFVKLDTMLLDDVEALVCQRLGVKSIPPQIGKLIREKSEGHPFFAEELAYALRDTGLLQIRGQECTLADEHIKLDEITLPDTLQAAITNRIDSLNPSQQLTLKVASVIGRIFAFRVLQAVHPIEEDKPALTEYMNTLTRMSLTLIESEAPDLAYIFKHAVTQEVAYNLMLYSQRRQLHQSVAEWIERSYERDISSYYALLAYHWSQAAVSPEPEARNKAVGKAVEYLEKAGDQSLNNFANAEAIQFFNQLLGFKNAVKPSKLRLGQWYRKLGMAYLGLGKLDEARQNFLTALTTLGQRVPASGVGMLAGLLGQLARQTGHRVWPRLFRRRITDPQGEAIRIEVVQILQQYATVLFLIGDPNPLPMFHSVVMGLNIAETIRETPELAYMYAQMGAICGFIPARQQARHYTEEWRALNENYYDANYFVGSVIALATVQSGIGEWKDLQERLEKALEICDSLGNNRQAGEAHSFLASNASIEGNVKAAAYYNSRLRENAMRRNNPVQVVWYYQWAACNALRLGNFDHASDCIQKALTVMERNPVGEVAEFVIRGIQAEMLWRQGDHEASLQRAKNLVDQAAKMQVVDYSVYVGFQPLMNVIFMALEQAHLDNAAQAGKDELLKYARLCAKIIKSYARVFTVGAPLAFYFEGWLAWFDGNKEKAFHLWRAAAQKARLFPMNYEEGLAQRALAEHLPAGSDERLPAFEKAKEAFVRGGFENWAETVQSAQSA